MGENNLQHKVRNFSRPSVKIGQLFPYTTIKKICQGGIIDISTFRILPNNETPFYLSRFYY